MQQEAEPPLGLECSPPPNPPEPTRAAAAAQTGLRKNQYNTIAYMRRSRQLTAKQVRTVATLINLLVAT